MKRTLHETKTGESSSKWRLRIEDDPSVPDSAYYVLRQVGLLGEVLEQPSLLRCGPVPFAKLRMFHTGTAWVIEAEADEYRSGE